MKTSHGSGWRRRAAFLRATQATVITLSLAGAAISNAATPCDPDAADAFALHDARRAIDADCPCDGAASAGEYKACAATTVRGLVEAGSLVKQCKKEALRYAKQSVCGRPGATVCCRVRSDGRPSKHRVVPDASQCIDTPFFTACRSPWQSTVTGCDDTGCVAPVCGNSVVETGETCDRPDGDTCNDSCQRIDCYNVVGSCGNGVIEDGEACEPPGVGTCGADCQAAPCNAPAPGEIAVACTAGSASVALGGKSDGYLAAWTGPLRRGSDVVARRYDVNAGPVDASPTIVSDLLPCGRASYSPSIGSDRSDYYVTWAAGQRAAGTLTNSIYGRRVGGAAGQGSLDELASVSYPYSDLIGQAVCLWFVHGPTATAGSSSSRFAAGWDIGFSCVFGPRWRSPDGAVLAPAARTDVPLGFGGFLTPPPVTASTSAADVGSLGSDILWAWHGEYWQDTHPPPEQSFVAAVWTDAAGVTTSPPLVLTNRKAYIGQSRPRVAPGAAALLVVWGQGAAADSTTLSEIRAVRATRALGSLDPDGGLLLATVAAQVTAGPVATFDGARWLVVWAESAGATNDLRAVAVEADGTVVDSSPRLVAADVAARDPALASAGDGRVLVLFGRPDAGNTAVRALLVSP